jgi:hypothetical protein
MEHVEFVSRNPVVSPSCNVCGCDARLVGVEPHPSHQRTDVWTYQCGMCGAVQTRDVARPAFHRRGER